MLATEKPPIPRGAWIALGLLVALGAALRFYGLDRDSLWRDEISTWDHGVTASGTGLFDLCRSGYQTPAYFLIVQALVQHVSDSPWWLRFPSALFGTLAVPLIFWLGWLLYSHREGLVAAACMAVLWGPVYYSQEARPYALLLLLSVGVGGLFLLLLRKLRDGGKFPLGLAAAYAGAAILICYTHYFGLLLVFLQGVAAALVCLRRRGLWVRAGLIYLAIVLAFLPWLAVFFSQLQHSDVYYSPPQMTDFFKVLRYYFERNNTFLFPVLALYLVGLVSGGRELWQAGGRSLRAAFALAAETPGCYLVAWLTAPALAVYLKSQASNSVWNNRYFIILAPAMYLLLARALCRLPLAARARAILAGGLVLIALAHLTLRMEYFTAPQKEQWREAVNFVLAHEPDREAPCILFHSEGTRTDGGSFSYFFKQAQSRIQPHWGAGRVQDLPFVEAHVAQARRFWCVWAHKDPEPGFLEGLGAKYRLLERKDFKNAGVMLFENPAAQGEGSRTDSGG